jgi:hypothetical protein
VRGHASTHLPGRQARQPGIRRFLVGGRPARMTETGQSASMGPVIRDAEEL